MLDRRSAVSLYRQLADELLNQIRTGTLAPGSELPSEATMSRQYEVSRDVVRDAMAVLRGEGAIITLRGRRSTIRRPAQVERLQAPPSAQITARMPTLEERNRLDILEGVPLIVVRTDEFEMFHAADRVMILTASDGQSPE